MEQTQQSPYPKGMIHHVRPTAKWGQLTQSSTTEDELKQACNRFIESKNLSYLFTGPNGDEKLQAAKIIASTLERDLYQVDFSSVVSRYDGQAEKNLKRLIKDSAETGAILYFDEVDPLFTTYREGKDSHEGLAIHHASSIIEMLKSYPGFAILASNIEKDREDLLTQDFIRIDFT